MNKRTISLRIDASVLAELESVSAAVHMSKTDWITEAVREKLARIAGNSDRLMRLPKRDCALVWLLVACLNKAPEATGFRRAVKANFDWLLESIQK